MGKHVRESVALVVGSGAIENAWAPVIRAIEPFYDFPLTVDGGNAFFARLVYLLRWWASIDTDQGRAELDQHIEFLRKVRCAISDELTSAERSGELRARPQLLDIANKWLVPYARRCVLVSTNWDTIVGKALVGHWRQDYRVRLATLHVHGSTADADTLYLPTELTREPYRSPSEDQDIGTTHGAVMRALESCEEVVIYGLSLSSLDAELLQVLASGFDNDKLAAIHIVDPGHAVIAHRVNLLLRPNRGVAVTGYAPESLDRVFDYTVVRQRAPDDA